jgi:signal transduction histidine kinase
MRSKFGNNLRQWWLDQYSELSLLAFLGGSRDVVAFRGDFRESGLRWLFYASFAGLAASAAFLVVDSLTLAESGFVTNVRILIIAILLVFSFCAVRFKSLVLRYYDVLVSGVLCAVLVGILGIVSTPGVVAIADGFSTGPLLVFCLFLIYGFVRLPLVLLVSVACLFTVCVLVLEGRWSGGPAYHRLVLYAALANFFGFLLAFFIVRREYLLFCERESLRLSKEGLRQRAIALQASRDDMSRLMRAVDHDLKQPLLAADVSIDALHTKLAAGDASDYLERLAELKRVISYLRSSAEDVLSLASLDDGWDSDLSAVDLRLVVRDVLTICSPLASAQGVRVIYRFAAGDLTANTNKVVVSRILLNLVVNAIKFTASKGVEGKKVLVVVRRTGDFFRLGVYDQGPGIEDADKENIWEPFFRVGSVGNVVGSGLGLYLVRRMVRRLRGHSLEMRSRPGWGTYFSVALLASRVNGAELGVGVAQIVGSYVIVYAPSGALLEDVRKVLADLRVDVDVITKTGALIALGAEAERLVDAVFLIAEGESAAGAWAEVLGFRQLLGGHFPIGVVGLIDDQLSIRGAYGDRSLDVEGVSFRSDLIQMVASGVARNVAIEARD